MLVDPVYGALVLPQVTAGQKMADHRCPVVSELARTAQKPVCVVWLSDWQEGPGAATYAADERIGFFRDTEPAFAPWLCGRLGTRHAERRSVSRPKLRPREQTRKD